MLNEAKNNYLLSILPRQDYERLHKYLEPVSLSLKEVLLEANQKIETIYFPTQGIVSLISVMQDGSTTEIGLIGREGIVGIFPFLGNGVLYSYTIVQLQGTAMAIDAEILQAQFAQSQSLQQLLLGYALNLFNQVSQCAACNNHHTVKQRFARWLMMIDDRLESDTLPFTQKFLSRMLGVRRTGVTEVARDIQQQGIIDYHRGNIKILDRPALEVIACECYQVLKL